MKDQITSERQKIDQIDVQLVQLLSERARVMASIGKLKAKSKVPVYDAARERQVLENITVLNKGPLDKGAMEEVFATIMGVCRQIEVR